MTLIDDSTTALLVQAELLGSARQIIRKMEEVINSRDKYISELELALTEYRNQDGSQEMLDSR